jgi:hypothetical protein
MKFRKTLNQVSAVFFAVHRTHRPLSFIPCGQYKWSLPTLLLQTLAKQLYILNLMERQQMVSRFEEVFHQMWINNGNEVSKIYAGTGAIQGGSKVSVAVWTYFCVELLKWFSILER